MAKTERKESGFFERLSKIMVSIAAMAGAVVTVAKDVSGSVTSMLLLGISLLGIFLIVTWLCLYHHYTSKTVSRRWRRLILAGLIALPASVVLGGAAYLGAQHLTNPGGLPGTVSSPQPIVSQEEEREPSLSRGQASNSEPVSNTDLDQLTVYVTDSGTKYHREGCRYLLSRNPLTLREPLERYSPCKVCRPPPLSDPEPTAVPAQSSGSS